MRRQRHLAYAGSLISTGATGRVVQSPFWGHEETRFRASADDVRAVRRGLKVIAEVFFAAGARRLILPTHRFRAIESPREIATIDEHVVSTKQFSFGSAHPQGGNPMSSDPSVVGPLNPSSPPQPLVTFRAWKPGTVVCRSVVVIKCRLSS